MVSAPTNVYTQDTANKAAKVRVFLGPEDGSNSDDFTESFELIPLEVYRIAGSRPDYAVFEFDTETIVENRDAADTLTPDGSGISYNRQVYIQVDDASQADYYDPDLDITVKFSKVIFWGELLTETLRIDPKTQRTTITARVADYHFGDLLEGEKHYDPLSQTFQTVPVDPIFNPLIDGVIEPNSSFETAFAVDPPLAYLLWIDPESVRTESARDLVAESNPVIGSSPPIPWNLKEIAFTLQEILLGSNEFIDGYEFSAAGDTVFEEAPEVENLSLRRGKHLNNLLDQILPPFGLDWHLDPTPFDPEAGEKPVISFFRRGQGVFKDVLLQAANEELDLTKSNATHIQIVTDVGNLANEIRGWGSFEQKELTIPLHRGWEESDDALTAEDLRRSDPASDYHQNGKTEAWRLWVGNESGDYTGLRTTTQPIDDFLDLSNEFELYIPRRRVVEDCLTLGSDGKRRVPWLIWSPDAGATWKEVPPEWGWVILPDQLGVRFTGDIPPEEIIEAGDDALMRITCTVTGDARLNSTSSPSLDESPSLRTVPLFLDLSDRYHKRSVQTTGDYASYLRFNVVFDEEGGITGLGDNPNGADEADDAADLQTFLADTLENELSAEMKCDFRLHGLHLEYEISDLITYVTGSEIYLNRNKGFSEKFVQVYGLRWLIQEQITELIVEEIDG